MPEDQVRLTIDFEFSSRTWWDEGGQDFWDMLTDGLDHSVVLEASVADSWVADAKKIEGWDDGHEYAPHPIAVVPVSEDEEAIPPVV